MTGNERYLAFMGQAPKKIPHWEHWSCPDAETFLTGIDYYEHPKLCRVKLKELYPQLSLSVPATDDPKPKPWLCTGNRSSDPIKHTVRWGDGESSTWEHGEKYFKTPEDVFRFSPLEKADFTDWVHVVENRDYSSEEVIFNRLINELPTWWGDKPPKDSDAFGFFYNTIFMWPLLTFGWEMFLETCLDERFERIMDEFAEINRRVFKALARYPVNFIVCHDDIVTTRGPVCSPKWMNKYIFPRYEEFWEILKSAGKEVIFMADGCMDAYADDVIACGARGIVSEPYTDYKKIAAKHKDCILAGEGDNRILMSNDSDQIKKMVLAMVDTAKINGGYLMCIGNHIPWNVPPQGIKYYLDYSAELACR